jgi:quinol monooxygenase YgiN
MEDDQITIRAEISIEEGKREEYKKLILDMSKAVETDEPYVIHYQFYLNSDESKCVVWETFANSEAVLAHTRSVASQTILPKISSISKIDRIDVYGNPNEELEKALTNFDAQIYNLFTGFNRYL